jgi:hypothetical protein
MARPTYVVRRLPDQWLVVGKAGFEPATSASRTLRAAKLRHFPFCVGLARTADESVSHIAPA